MLSGLQSGSELAAAVDVVAGYPGHSTWPCNYPPLHAQNLKTHPPAVRLLFDRWADDLARMCVKELGSVSAMM